MGPFGPGGLEREPQRNGANKTPINTRMGLSPNGSNRTQMKPLTACAGSPICAASQPAQPVQPASQPSQPAQSAQPDRQRSQPSLCSKVAAQRGTSVQPQGAQTGVEGRRRESRRAPGSQYNLEGRRRESRRALASQYNLEGRRGVEVQPRGAQRGRVATWGRAGPGARGSNSKAEGLRARGRQPGKPRADGLRLQRSRAGGLKALVRAG